MELEIRTRPGRSTSVRAFANFTRKQIAIDGLFKHRRKTYHGVTIVIKDKRLRETLCLVGNSQKGAPSWCNVLTNFETESLK